MDLLTVFSRIDFPPLLRKGGKWILDDSLGVYAPEAALGGFPGGRASHGEAGKGRKAPYGVLRRERCLHAVCSERWEGQGTKHLSTDFSHFSPDFLVESRSSLGCCIVVLGSP